MNISEVSPISSCGSNGKLTRMQMMQTAVRANSYLSGFKRQGRIPAVVDFVASGSRFK